ncbi:MAG: hypothetical protein ACI9EQ_002179, partial [Bacteroidia bacterium]
TGKQVALIHSGELSFGSHDFVIEASSLKSAGVYLIQIDNDQGRSVRKLVIQ